MFHLYERVAPNEYKLPKILFDKAIKCGKQGVCFNKNGMVAPVLAGSNEAHLLNHASRWAFSVCIQDAFIGLEIAV